MKKTGKKTKLTVADLLKTPSSFFLLQGREERFASCSRHQHFSTSRSQSSEQHLRPQELRLFRRRRSQTPHRSLSLRDPQGSRGF
ncbi:hypothetical protein glysoja_006280 [Glycine soja]|nr:hypothetical protein glysoja_006280 [Glycine soja]